MAPPESANKAVFLSYASQDAEAARRICEALRLAGVEVWFDQSELRGGEAWDRSIRWQIRECALFLPIISASTQARLEGYFRLEWKLAEDRSHLMAKGKPFIIPVAIDATTDREAMVPDAFLTVQWTRLLDGATSLEFAEQVKRLLSGDVGRDLRIPPASSKAGFADPALQQKDGPPQIPDFDVLRLIGQGSYGDVWLARSVTGIYRAIKVVWRARFNDAQPYEREFRGLKEFAAISLGESIQMALLHVGRNDAAGFFYYVMELADDVDRGRDIDPVRYVPLTLTEVRARNGRVRVPAKDCLAYGLELTRVLAGLHRRGLIHRDIKPSNVILVGGVPKLADIGLVTPADATMTYVGTEGFVPPEGPGSASADVFALGRLLYELATGLDRTEFPQLPADLKKLPDHRLLLELNEIILKACDPVPANRYRDGAALLADLSALQAGSSMRQRRIGAGILRAALPSVAILAVAAVAYWQWPRAAPAPSSLPPAPSQLSQLDPKSVAVLAFANLSGDPGNEYFSDGISEDLLTVLQKIPGLKVTARSSSFHFKGKDTPLPEIAKQLGVAYVVEGSVRRSGDKVRITAQLIKAADGFHVWSEKYDRDPKDIFAVQDEIAQTIVAQVRGLLTGVVPDAADRAAIAAQVREGGKGGTRNLEAYEQYLQGLYYYKMFSLEDQARAVGYFQRATVLDPVFALAYSFMARALGFQSAYSSNRERAAELDAQSRKALDRALALEPDLASGLGVRAEMLAVEYDWRGADKAVRRALELAPSDPALLIIAAQMWGWLGQPEKAVELARQARRLDPLNVEILVTLSSFLSVLGQHEESQAVRRRVIELAPDIPFAYAGLALDYLYQGRFDEAAEWAKKEKVEWIGLAVLAHARWGQGNIPEADQALQQLKAQGDNVSLQIAQVYAYRHDLDQAFAWLERAFQMQEGGICTIKLDRVTDSLKADPRWPAFLRKVGMHDDQVAEFLPDFLPWVTELGVPVKSGAPASSPR